MPHMLFNLVLAAVMLLAAAPPAAAEGPRVVASFSILADMVRQVGGKRVRVTALVGPGGDVHVYQPSPGDTRVLAGADLLVVNGLGFEGWLGRLIAASGFTGPVAVASRGTTLIAADGDNDHAGDADDRHAHDGDADPHAWQDLANARVYARNIAAALCAVDTGGCAGYRTNAAAYDARLAALDAELHAAFAALPPQRRRLVTSHDAFAHFARAYGVEMLAPGAASTDSEPSAADVARLIRQIREDGVRAIFVETISDPRLIEQIARETGVAIGGKLYSDTLSGAGGPAPTYLDMMRHNGETIRRALEQQGNG